LLRRAVDQLPTGGGTPLALGLDAARELVQAVQRGGESPVLVVLTDGRANIARDGSPGRAQAAEDALAAARELRALGVPSLLIDTAPQPQTTAQALAEGLGGAYLPLPHADARAMSQAVRLATARR
ncbi:MAG: magnesium chelatase ATPase subunit D, partial [Burkholderiaceae bacterium]